MKTLLKNKTLVNGGYSLNQAPGFQKFILSKTHVSARVHPRLLITSGVIWTPYDTLNKFYSLYMAAVVIISGECGLRIEVHHRNQPCKTKLFLYKPFLHNYRHSKQLYIHA